MMPIGLPSWLSVNEVSIAVTFNYGDIALNFHRLSIAIATASVRAQAKSCCPAATKQHDGQITQNPVQSFSKKYFA
jgi:hypothetical protein